MELAGQLQKALNFEEFINHLPLQTWRPIRSGPGRLSESVREAMRVTKLVPDGEALRDEIGDGLGLIGARTIRAFEFALRHFEFDYLIRTNSSSFLSLELLASILPKRPEQGVIHALTGKWGPISYPSGALYALCRADVEAVVKQKNQWIHELMDDVALGLMLASLRPRVAYVSIERHEFSFFDPLDGQPPAEIYSHYRCKARDPDVAIERMISLAKAHGWLSD